MSLNLTRIPSEKREEAKREAGDFIINEILRAVSRGQSPVAGRGSFPKLNSTYADREKGGNRTPNLELEGDMLDALTYNTTAGGLEIGIFKDSEVDKAEGHNNFEGQSKLPTRRFIPSPSEDFKPNILNGVRQILDGYRQDESGESILDRADDFLITSARTMDILSTSGAIEGITIEQVVASLGGSLE